MKQLIVFRHAPVLDKGLCYGRFDPRVQEIANELDAPIAHLLQRQREEPTMTLVSSPADRCLQVARRMGQRLGLAVNVSPLLAEISMGDWEGRPYSELEALPEFEHWMSHWQEAAPPGGETIRQLEQRVEEFLRGFEDATPVVAVTHAGVIRCLRVVLEGKTWQDAMNEPVPHLQGISFNVPTDSA